MSESSTRVEIHRGAGNVGWKERSSMLPKSGCFCENTTSSSCEYSCSCGNGLGGDAMLFNQMLLVIQKLATCNLGLHKPSSWLCFSPASTTSQWIIQFKLLLYLTVKSSFSSKHLLHLGKFLCNNSLCNKNISNASLGILKWFCIHYCWFHVFWFFL